jgi:hypothetical protein
MNLSSLFLLFLTVSVCGILVLNSSAFTSYDIIQPSSVKIEIEAVSGGDRYNDTVRFQDNVLILRHAGGRLSRLIRLPFKSPESAIPIKEFRGRAVNFFSATLLFITNI